MRVRFQVSVGVRVGVGVKVRVGVRVPVGEYRRRFEHRVSTDSRGPRQSPFYRDLTVDGQVARGVLI